MRSRCSLLFFIFCSFFVYSQFNITGKVVDENGEPIAFANVIFPNTSYGTTTDFDGLFDLSAPTRQNEVKVNLLGYQTQIISLKKRNPFLKIVLLQSLVSFFYMYHPI